MDPVTALRRIAYLLEAEGAATYKVRAFRKAAGTVAATDADVLEGLLRSRRLEQLEGVGSTTASVVAEAAAGGVPAYLSALEARRPPPLDGAAAVLRGALLGDLHAHSTWSDGGATIEAMALAAAGVGHRYLALTDHSPRLTVAHGLDATRLAAQLEEIARLNDRLAPFRILTGIEVDIFEDGSLDQDPALLARLDVVVASAHSKLAMEPGPMTRRLVAAVRDPHVDVLGHCTGRLLGGRGRPPSRFDAATVFAACAEAGTAVEVNCRPERDDPPDALLAIAVGAGCRFAIDTDAHAEGQLEWLERGCRRAAAAGIGAERVENARPLADLLAASSPGA